MEDIIREASERGLKQVDIRRMLSIKYNIALSRRQLQYKMNKMNIKKSIIADIGDVAVFIEQTINKYGSLHGYRWMHVKCIKNGLFTSRDTVEHLMKIIDTDGVESRKSNRLCRRVYSCKGPNFIWHIDGYDKLKPYGLAIHGCIDGYSRHMMWCRASHSNNDPKIVGGFYVKTVLDNNIVPRVIRADCGTENVLVAHMQRLLRQDHNDGLKGEKSFMSGSSCLNQRIEFWWGILRKECVQYWMELLNNLKVDNLFRGDQIDKNLVRYCFIDVLQKQLDGIVEEWNSHYIRKTRNQPVPYGIPKVLYKNPELSGSEECGLDFNHEYLLNCAEESTFDNVHGDQDIFELCAIYMAENRWIPPTSPHEGMTLYKNLREKIVNDL